MRQTKEEKIIEHGTSILEELHRIYKEGLGIDEYYKLLSEYKKLYRRFEKTIKLSDNMGNEIMGKNDLLKDNLQYTISKARAKLMDNVVEHRKTKEASSAYLLKLKEYENELRLSYRQNAKLEKQLALYMKSGGVINSAFNGEEISIKEDFNLNPTEYKSINITQLLSIELTNENKNIILIKLALRNFKDMIETIESSSSVPKFISGIYKYLLNNLNKDDIVFHDNNEIFYVLVKDKSLVTVKTLMEQLNKKRKILGFDITFSMGITAFIENKDTSETFLKRCDEAYNDAVNGFNSIVIK